MSAEDSSPAPATVWQRAWPALLVAAVAIACFANTLTNALVYDDKVMYVNEALHDPWDLARIWTSPWWGASRVDNALYRPLASFTLALTWWANERMGLAGDAPQLYHAFNVLAHAVASVLVLTFARAIGIGRTAAIAAAVVFAAHALHVEAVAPASGRSEVLATAFGLAFLVLHLRKKGSAWAALALLAALCSKESALAFLPLAWAAELTVGGATEPRPSLARRIAPHAVYAGAAIAWFLARTWCVRSVREVTPFVDNPMVDASTFERVLTASVVQLSYLRFQLLPTGLQSDAGYDQVPIVSDAGDVRVLAFLAIVAAACVWAVRSWKRTRIPALVVLGYTLLFALTSNYLFVIGTPRSDRLAYAPSVFFCLTLGLALARALAGRGALTWVAIGLLACGHGALTVERNRVWRDELTLFREQAHASPRSAKAHFNLAATLAAQGENRAALAEYERALAIHPEYHLALFYRGHALRRLDEHGRAVASYLRALEVEPRFVEPVFGLIETMHELGRDDAARAYAEQLRLDAPNHPRLPQVLQLLGLEPVKPGSPPSK